MYYLNVAFSSRWKLVDVITEKLADCPEEQETWRKSVINAAVKCLIAAYSHYKDQATSPSEQEKSILERVQQLLVGLSFSHTHTAHALFLLHAFDNLFSLHRHQLKTSLRLNGTALSRMD